MQPSGISVSIRESLVEGSSRTQTTLVVDPLITKDGTRVTMASFGDIAFAKIDVGTSQEEIMSFTGITDNTTTYTLTGVVWGYNFHNITGNVNANKKRHTSGASFIIGTDFHYIKEQYVDKDNAQTIAGVKTFTASPIAPTPTTDYQVATKQYADGLAIAGSPDSSATVKGISKMSTAPASATEPIAVGDNDVRISGTSGTAVSGSNKLVDNADTATDGTASKIVRLDANSQATVAATPTAATHAASKGYVDSSNIITLTAKEVISVGQTVSIYSDGEAVLTDTSRASASNYIGIAQNTVSAGGSVNVAAYGVAEGLTSLSLGSLYYGQDRTHTERTLSSTLNSAIAANGKWQSFTTLSGETTLTRISIQTGAGPFTATGYFNIYTGEGVAGTLLGRTDSFSISGSQTITTPTQVTIPVTELTQYTVEFILSSGTYEWGFATSDTYAGGRASTNAGYDFYLKVSKEALAAGRLGTSAGTVSQLVGRAISATELIVK